MSSFDYLKAFVHDRLTAAAEEIFGVLKKTIVEYEEEIGRQRKLLDDSWKPGIKLKGPGTTSAHLQYSSLIWFFFPL